MLETDILIEEQGLGGVAVVMDGMKILRKVEDGKAFHKKDEKKTTGKEKVKGLDKIRKRQKVLSEVDERHQNASSEDDEGMDSEGDLPPVKARQVKSKTAPVSRPIVPLPSRVHSSTSDLRPSKRKRQELSDDDNNTVHKSSTSRVAATQKSIPQQSRSQVPFETRNMPLHPPVTAHVVHKSTNPPSGSHHPRESSHAASHRYRTQTPQSAAPARVPPVLRYSLQPPDASSRHHHAPEPTHRADHIPHQVPFNHNEPSGFRPLRHRQLTPIYENPNYSRQRLPSQGVTLHQYHIAQNRTQPPLHSQQSHLRRGQSSRLTSHTRQAELDDIEPIHHSTGYRPRDTRGHEEYDRYHGDEVYDSENDEYGDIDVYGE